MKKDIHNREDIILLVDTFYKNVALNKQIGPIFTDVAKVDWSHHLPKMYDFWESILFGKAIYKGNPMLTHFALNEQIPLQTEAFETWKNLFFQTVDDLFAGENADLIKQKAQSIADLMHFKINSPQSKIKIV
ncbi:MULTISPECIES: group III truncated hemoglobin [unclassified Pedobacter]|uniref:group III truncated hemoglobin n=1 Tax=unclassified Pedobacter TaxID=2628915 RepID=UPI001D2F6E14|nr:MULTISPECIES: group III truncated hemoglobin [unclassified Pedobacter]CAH0156689.1 Group 3 truncated hemoglobin ctb [Pedobacter sp. Bi126]CAH0201601.1 Group 3 truncated hemoglobin ctb [Pedobacter sp. Bi36]